MNWLKHFGMVLLPLLTPALASAVPGTFGASTSTATGGSAGCINGGAGFFTSSCTDAFGANSTSSFASLLAGGDLSGSGTDSGPLGNAAHALIWTNVTFKVPSPGIATGRFKSVVTRTLTGDSVVNAGIDIVDPVSGFVLGGSECRSASSCWVAGTATLEFTFNIFNNSTVQFVAAIDAGSIRGNYTFDPSWSLSLPAGVTYTTADGIAFPGAPFAVPEPTSAALMSAGILGMALFISKKRRSAGDSTA